MRNLIFLLALISAFFVSAEPDMDDLRSPKVEPMTTYQCINTSYPRVESLDECLAIYKQSPANESPDGCETLYKIDPAFSTSTKYSLTVRKQRKSSSPPYACTSYSPYSFKLIISDEQITETKSCPPNGMPLHKIDVFDSMGQHMCAKELESEPEPEKDPDCPDPTDNDPFVFGSGGGQTSVCFPAGNGRQCEIKTDSNGGYYIPISYGSAEPTTCIPDPDPEPKPEPEPTPDPEKPDDKDDPTPTPDPDNPEPPKDADDSDQTDILDAVNQVNDNLNVINDNMNLGIETHNERLDRMAKETQNSNELLGSIKQNTASTTLNTGKTILEIGKTNTILEGVKTVQTEGVKLHVEGVKLLDEIKENTKKDDFTFTSGGRMAGGLDSVFTFEEMAQFDKFIESAEKRRFKLIDDIKKETETLFTIDPNLNSQYEQRLETIKGVQVDLGLSRFSDFFKLIAPAILLAGTLTGLYILLGSNRE